MGIDTDGAYRKRSTSTPGLHIEEKRAINRLMNPRGQQLDRRRRTGDLRGRRHQLDRRRRNGGQQAAQPALPVLLAINKVDNVTDKSSCCRIAFLSQQMNFLDVVLSPPRKG